MEEIQSFFFKNTANKKIQDLQSKFQLFIRKNPGNKEQFLRFIQSILLIIKKYERISSVKLTNFTQIHEKTQILQENLQKKREIYKENFRNLELLQENSEKPDEISMKNSLETYKISLNDLSIHAKKTIKKMCDICDIFDKKYDIFINKNMIFL